MISIIIPVYNIEEYVYSCLGCLEAQNISKDLFEVVLIDDCSTDNTLSKIKSYNGDINLRVESLSKNSRTGAARKRGLEIAKGEYILFLDADDLLVPNALKLITNEIKEKNADLVTYNWTYLSDLDSGNYVPRRRDLSDMPVDRDSLVKHYLGMNMDGSIIYTVAKKSLFEEYDIVFPDEYHSDVAVILQMYYAASKICKLDKVIYIKNDREGSILNTYSKSHIDGYLINWSIILDFLRRYESEDTIKSCMPHYYRGMSGLVYTCLVKTQKTYSQDMNQRAVTYGYIWEALKRDSNLTAPYDKCLPDKTDKDKLTQRFVSCMSRDDVTFEERVKLFENE